MKKLLIVIFSLLVPTLAFAAETQTNVSGSNTSIEGGYEQSTTYESGSESSSTTTNTSHSNIRSAPPTSSAHHLVQCHKMYVVVGLV